MATSILASVMQEYHYDIFKKHLNIVMKYTALFIWKFKIPCFANTTCNIIHFPRREYASQTV